MHCTQTLIGVICLVLAHLTTQRGSSIEGNAKEYGYKCEWHAGQQIPTSFVVNRPHDALL
jgi:hypothetical protein